MATDVFINIKDLPEVTEPKDGDYLIIETATGTNLIDFKNFTIPTKNTVISTSVSQNTDAISYLSARMDSRYDTLSSLITNNDINISNLSSEIKSNENTNLNIAYTQITIPKGNREGSALLTKGGSTQFSNSPKWKLSDVIVVPANEYAVKYPAYPISVDSLGVVTIKGNFHINRIISIASTPLLLTTSLANTGLSTLNSQPFVDSLSVKITDIDYFIKNLALSAEEIPAQEAAVYNVYGINYYS